MYCGNCENEIEIKNDKKNVKIQRVKSFLIIVLSVLLIASVVLNIISFIGEDSDITQDGKATEQQNDVVVKAYDKERIEKARSIICEKWENEARLSHLDEVNIEIKNTRIIWIKENNNEFFSDVECIVEFVIFSDYLGSAPYMQEVQQNNVVLLKNDGSYEIGDYIKYVFQTTYGWNHIDCISEITDYGTAFNCNKKY